MKNKTKLLILLPIYTFIFLFIMFVFCLNNVNAQSYINVKNVTHGFSGSVWNGSKIVNTYNSADTPSYKGYTSVGNNVMFKIYFDSSAMLNINKYDMELLTQTRWLYSMQFCSTIPVPNNYTIAYSGNGDVITTYPVITGGSCALGSNLFGTLYTYNAVVQYTNPNTGTVYMDGHIVIDFNNGNTTTAGSYAVINWNVAEFTEELKNQYDQIIQNNQVINQNNTIINQNNQTNQNLNNIDNSIKDVDNTIKDETPPNLSAFNDYAGWLPPGPLDSILNLPLTLLNSLTNLFSNQCQPANIPIPFLNTTIELPCVTTIYDKIGNLSTIINTLCIPVIAYILFKYFMHLYNWVDKTLTFRENNYIDNWGGV